MIDALKLYEQNPFLSKEQQSYIQEYLKILTSSIIITPENIAEYQSQLEDQSLSEEEKQQIQDAMNIYSSRNIKTFIEQ